jgi:hypothetical protein
MNATEQVTEQVGSGTAALARSLDRLEQQQTASRPEENE